MNKRFIVVHGPTGVGKTECITSLSQMLPIEIINGDVGQFYEPFSIGTAKPDWRNESVPHHLFDYIKSPIDCTVIEYREQVKRIMRECWQRGTIPVVVGGTLFYGQALFFPPLEQEALQQTFLRKTYDTDDSTHVLWKMVYDHDPVRAEKIGPTDRYRIMRALEIIDSGLQPSSLEPVYDPIEGNALVIFLKRDREQLYKRINDRVVEMLSQGWINEVRRIVGTEWQDFLERKKLIGYTEILSYVKQEDCVAESYDAMVCKIQQKTRNYAKRQETFWRMLYKKLENNIQEPRPLLHMIDLSNVQGTALLEQFIKEFCF